MMKNNSFTEIMNALKKADSIIILTHVVMDGDTVGSAAALCRALINFGKTAHIYLGEPFLPNLKLVDFDAFIKNKKDLLEKYDIAVSIDCSDRGRFEQRKSYFENAKLRINIDHHMTNDYYADLNYIDPDAPATGEIIYKLLETTGITVDSSAAEDIYIAISTDTGQFQYSSTTGDTHRIISKLFDIGIDINKINVALYQSDSKEKYTLMGDIFQTIEFLENDKFAFAYADIEMFKRQNALIQDSDGIVEMLRNINTVEVAAFAKEISDGVMKVGFRSKYDINVALLAQKFGGGGHTKASGCTIKGTIDDVKKVLYPEIEKIFSEKRTKGQ